MKNIAQLCETAHEMSKSKGFWDCLCTGGIPAHDGHHETASCVNLSLDMKITLIRSELSEALEEFRMPETARCGPLSDIQYEDTEHGVFEKADRISGPEGRRVLKAWGDIDPSHKNETGNSTSQARKEYLLTQRLKPVGFMAEMADAAIRIFDLVGRLKQGDRLQHEFEALFYRTRPVVPVGALMEEAHYNLSWIGGMLIQDNVAKAIPLFVRTLVVLEDLVTTVSAGKGRGDLDEAIITKMAYNSKRPFRHGKTC